MKTPKILLILLLLVVSALPTAQALSYVNGTVKTSIDNTGLGSVTVTFNSTSAISNATTGNWWICCQSNGTGTLTYTIQGYTSQSNTSTITRADLATPNGSNNVSLVPITPAQGTVTVTKGHTSATLSVNVTAGDNVNNNYVGNRIRYSLDSALTNNVFTTAWSNDTVAPSFTLSNLNTGYTWYYSFDTYNEVSSAYSVSTTGNFKTTSGKEDTGAPTTYVVTQEQVNKLPQTVKNQIPQLASQNNDQNKKIAFFVLIAIGLIYVLKPKHKVRK